MTKEVPASMFGGQCGFSNEFEMESSVRFAAHPLLR